MQLFAPYGAIDVIMRTLSPALLPASTLEPIISATDRATEFFGCANLLFPSGEAAESAWLALKDKIFTMGGERLAISRVAADAAGARPAPDNVLYVDNAEPTAPPHTELFEVFSQFGTVKYIGERTMHACVYRRFLTASCSPPPGRVVRLRLLSRLRQRAQGAGAARPEADHVHWAAECDRRQERADECAAHHRLHGRQGVPGAVVRALPRADHPYRRQCVSSVADGPCTV